MFKTLSVGYFFSCVERVEISSIFFTWDTCGKSLNKEKQKESTNFQSQAVFLCMMGGNDEGKRGPAGSMVQSSESMAFGLGGGA